MSDFDTLAQKANTQKVVLLEIDIGEIQDFLTNHAAGVWFVNFDVNYPNIDSSLLVGVEAQDIELVGSVAWDGVQLAQVSSVAEVETTDSSFFFSDPELYIRGVNGNSPAGHSVLIGVSTGLANFVRTFNNQTYEARVLSVPSIGRSKDPVFFGKVSFDSGAVTVDNNDGRFDEFGEDNDVFGNAARLRLGFDDLPFSEYRVVFSGFVESLAIGRSTMVVQIQDQRKALQRAVGLNVFNLTDYPDLDPDNVDNVIPLAYGTVKNAPCTVLNELEGGTPSWTVKLADPIHDITSVTEVRVEGVAVTPTATDLTLAEVTLANGDFSPGDEVTADFVGYEESASTITNGLDVIKDLLTEFFPIEFDSNFFNVPEWNAATLLAPDVGLWVGVSTPVIDLIEDISDTIFGSFIVEDGGTFTYRIFDDPGSSAITFRREEILDWEPIDYDPSESITSTLVGYDRDLSTGRFLLLEDRSQETTLQSTLNLLREGQFDTLLFTAGDAQDFSDTVLELQGLIRKIVEFTVKMQAIDIEVGDFINAQLDRPTTTALGFVYGEVLGIDRNLSAFEITITLRIIKRIEDPQPTLVTSEEHYNAADTDSDTFYGDDVYYGGIVS